ncbi:hypothetical protein SAMN05216326_11614 [Nitrosomonas marina]|uniref:Uncharacterized protein n=1 Tax=Nitrosomonas marina TaxID=917 RepID=A0A1I0CRY3_9PROT|nr:hypothetical protein SAMN05216326_11614 [Nitrosomonas marina]
MFNENYTSLIYIVCYQKTAIDNELSRRGSCKIIMYKLKKFGINPYYRFFGATILNFCRYGALCHHFFHNLYTLILSIAKIDD